MLERSRLAISGITLAVLTAATIFAVADEDAGSFLTPESQAPITTTV